MLKTRLIYWKYFFIGNCKKELTFHLKKYTFQINYFMTLSVTKLLLMHNFLNKNFINNKIFKCKFIIIKLSQERIY